MMRSATSGVYRGSRRCRVRENAVMPRPVSVQICTLNEEGNIGECLETVVANDPEEIVVIDGGSTDRTVEIAEVDGRTGAGARSARSRTLATARLPIDHQPLHGFRRCRRPAGSRLARDDGPRAGGGRILRPAELAPRCSSPAVGGARGWNQYFIESVRPTADTTMVGRPALFVTAALQSDEATSSPRRGHAPVSSLRAPGASAGDRLGGRLSALSRRPGTRTSEVAVLRAWLPRVRRRAPRAALRHRQHMLFTVPIARSLRPVLRGNVTQPIFGVLMAANIVRGWSSSS